MPSSPFLPLSENAPHGRYADSGRPGDAFVAESGRPQLEDRRRDLRRDDGRTPSPDVSREAFLTAPARRPHRELVHHRAQRTSYDRAVERRSIAILAALAENVYSVSAPRLMAGTGRVGMGHPTPAGPRNTYLSLHLVCSLWERGGWNYGPSG